MKLLISLEFCYLILATVLATLCQGSVIPATHTVPIAVTPTYALTPARPAIVTAASNQVVTRNFNRFYVPGYVGAVTPVTPTYGYASYPTTYYKYPIYPYTYTYGYGYPNYPTYYYK